MTHPSHLDLFAAGRAVQRAAADDDIDRLHTELCRLRTALVEHLHDERGTLGLMGEAARGVVAGGQRRLLEMVDQLLAATGDGRSRVHLPRASG